MSWDSYELENGNIMICRMDYDETWGAWGEVELTPEQLKRWESGDKEMRKYVEDNLK